MLQVEILGGVVVDGDDIKTNGPVVVDEFLVLGPYTSIEAQGQAYPVGFQDGVAGRNEVFQGDGLTPVSFLPCRWIFQMPSQDSYSLPCGMETIFLDFLNNPVMAAFKNFKTLLMRL